MCSTSDICVSVCLCICVPGLLHPGDLLVEVNGNPVVGLEPEQVIQILVRHQVGGCLKGEEIIYEISSYDKYTLFAQNN